VANLRLDVLEHREFLGFQRFSPRILSDIVGDPEASVLQGGDMRSAYRLG
jgi:hypothetical protein